MSRLKSQSRGGDHTEPKASAPETRTDTRSFTERARQSNMSTRDTSAPARSPAGTVAVSETRRGEATAPHSFVPSATSNTLNCADCGESREEHWRKSAEPQPARAARDDEPKWKEQPAKAAHWTPSWLEAAIAVRRGINGYTLETICELHNERAGYVSSAPYGGAEREDTLSELERVKQQLETAQMYLESAEAQRDKAEQLNSELLLKFQAIWDAWHVVPFDNDAMTKAIRAMHTITPGRTS